MTSAARPCSFAELPGGFFLLEATAAEEGRHFLLVEIPDRIAALAVRSKVGGHALHLHGFSGMNGDWTQ